MSKLIRTIGVIISLLIFLISGLYCVELKTHELSNGLDVILLKDKKVPLATIVMAVRTGATCETDTTNGLAHLYEHMFFKGNKKLPDQKAYKKRVKELGIVYNGATSNESVNYYFTLPANNLDEGMTFMKNAIRYPLFDKEQFQKEKSVIVDELNRNASRPGYDFSEKVDSIFFHTAPWRFDPGGSKKVVKEATRDQMLYFKNRYYVPNNSALIVAGDIEFDNSLELAKKSFQSWEKGTNTNYDSLAYFEALQEDKKVEMSRPIGSLSRVLVRYWGPKATKQREDTYPADIWSQLLNLESGKFKKNLVDDGPFLQISGGYYTQKFAGTINFSGAVSPGQEDKAVKMLKKEIKKFYTQEDYFTEEQVEKVKNIIVNRRLMSKDNIRNFAIDKLSFWWTVFGSLDYYKDYIPNLQQVTHEQVINFCRKYLKDKHDLTGILTPSKTK